MSAQYSLSLPSFVRNSLLAKWLREWVRVRVRAGGKECTPFFFFTNVVNIFVFIGSVASYEYLIR